MPRDTLPRSRMLLAQVLSLWYLRRWLLSEGEKHFLFECAEHSQLRDRLLETCHNEHVDVNALGTVALGMSLCRLLRRPTNPLSDLRVM